MTSPAQTTTEVFSRVALKNGDERGIAVLSRPGDRPCVVVARFRERRFLTKTLFHGPDLSLLRAALEAVRDPTLRDRRDVGERAQGRAVTVRVWVSHFPGRPRAVCFGRSVLGKPLGGATTIAGAELVALERAVERAQKVTAAMAAERRTA